jgi:hypothetical protein
VQFLTIIRNDTINIESPKDRAAYSSLILVLLGNNEAARDLDESSNIRMTAEGFF